MLRNKTKKIGLIDAKKTVDKRACLGMFFDAPVPGSMNPPTPTIEANPCKIFLNYYFVFYFIFVFEKKKMYFFLILKFLLKILFDLSVF